MATKSSVSWIDKLKSAKKAGILQNGKVDLGLFASFSNWHSNQRYWWEMLFNLDRKKVHYTFDDQTEMVEEYDAKTNVLLSKKTIICTQREKGLFDELYKFANGISLIKVDWKLRRTPITGRSKSDSNTKADLLSTTRLELLKVKRRFDLLFLGGSSLSKCHSFENWFLATFFSLW